MSDDPLLDRLSDDKPLTVAQLFEPNPPAVEDGRPLLWSRVPETVVHIAAPAMHVFGIYLRQRCAWCGVVLLEYDLRRLQFRVDDPGPRVPAVWTVMSLVRVDGSMSAEIENPQEVDGDIQLPTDSCCFDPQTQIR